MIVLRIAGKSLRQHALSTSVAAFSIALAAGLVMSVWGVKEQAEAAFAGVDGGFDAVLGARGSKLQLVLNAVFHLEASPGNVAPEDYQEIQSHPLVEAAVPVAVGDNYRGYRLVGTTHDLFKHTELDGGRRLEVEPGGRLFDLEYREAVVGSFAAERLNLQRGDSFHPFHGLLFDERHRHSETYRVVGLLKPSNTPADRVIWIPLAGVQTMSGHDPDAAEELSAVLVKLQGDSAAAGFQLDRIYNREGSRLTLAWPIGQSVAELFEKIAWFGRVLECVALLVVLVAAASVLASIYNSMNERRREIAILRALGARRWIVFCSVIAESSAIAALGALAGFLFHFAAFVLTSGIIRHHTGVVLNPWATAPVMIWAPALLVVLGAAAGVLPALKAYQTPVAENLVPHS